MILVRITKFNVRKKVYFSLKVKYWITFNEPLTFIALGYSGTFAPRINCPGTCVYQVAHNVIKAHAAVYRLYNSTFRASQQGKLKYH